MRARLLAFWSLGLFFSGCSPPALGLEELARRSLSRLDGEVAIEGLSDDVEVLRDRWGIPHPYAMTIDDRFLAQGFVTAQDRLWQMEVWRRWSEGRMAELIGEEGLAHDRLVRMLQFRGPFDERELTSYHPDGPRIFAGFARGVNAFLAHRASNLPVEFQLTGLTPEPWTAETVLLRARVGAVVSDARAELRLARAAKELGPKEANAREEPDHSLAIIAPGQSGQPGSPHYDDLLDLWVKGEMFELPYTREAVEAATAHRLLLRPR